MYYRTQRLHLSSHQPVHNRQEPPQELPSVPSAQVLRSGHDEVWWEAALNFCSLFPMLRTFIRLKKWQKIYIFPPHCRCTTWEVWLSKFPPSPNHPDKRRLCQAHGGQRSCPKTYSCPTPSLTVSSWLQGARRKWVFRFVPWAASALHPRGGASADLSKASDEETVHGEHRDDFTHTASWQRACPHDQLGQEDSRSVSVCLRVSVIGECVD